MVRCKKSVVYASPDPYLSSPLHANPGLSLGSPHANLSHGSLSAKQSTDHLVSGRSSPGPIRTLSATIMRKQPSEPAMAGQSPNMHSHDHSMHRPAYGGPGRYASSPAMEFSPHNSPMSANCEQNFVPD